MQIKEVKYRRVFNLGNYETEHVEYTAEINADEEPLAVLNEIRILVNGEPEETEITAYPLRDGRGDIRRTLDTASEWLRAFDEASILASDKLAFVNKNSDIFAYVKRAAQNNPSPRALARVQDVENRVMELTKNG